MSLCFAMSASLLFGQLESNSVTVTASRSANVQPDQVLLAVYVNSGINASLDDVLAVLKTSGITITNFSGVSTNSTFGLIPVGGVPLPQPTPPTLQWAFGLPVPFSKMKDTLAALTSLQQSIIHANSGFTLSFTVQGAQVSPGLQQQSQTCSISDLIAEASAQAHKLASAAGLSLGSILAMSSVASNPVENNFVPAANFGNGTFVSAILTTPPGCVLTVKFALTRF
jgi:hypothetical protein